MKSSVTHLIFAIVAFIAILAGYIFWYSIITSMSINVTTLQNKIDSKTEMINRMSTTQATIAEIADDEAVVQNRFISEDGIVAFINDLENKGRTLGSSVNVLSVSKGDSHDKTAFTFSISIKGTFDIVMRTVGAIEYAPYAISITALSVGQDNDGNWNANMKLFVWSSSKDSTTNTL